MTDDLQERAIPDGMVPWSGGECAPDDWDGGPALLRSGKHVLPFGGGNPRASCLWESDGDECDIIAYTPKPAPNALQEREVIQADRDAAAGVYGADKLGSAECLSGRWDSTVIVQAFARHRLAFASPTPEPSGAVVREALEGADYAAHLAIEKGIEQGAVHWRKGLELVQELCRTALASLDAGSASS